ncbi:MAG: outer membrane lipoprotein-sorting protein [Gammaproteobacteria bacterium]|nr:outer membrane lipoprotein-sorting protein [Gammaproteobacteria bacterium]
MSSLFFSRLVLPTFIFAACFSSVAQARTDQSALDVLMRMQTASQNINYYGTLVFLHNGQVQSMRVVHKADETGRFERLINLNGVAREVVRKDDLTICYMPDSKEVMVSRQKFKGNVNMLTQLAGNDFAQLQKSYRFTLESMERVAGREARRIFIQPKDSLRYGYRLWVDDEKSILLKSDLLNEQGESLEQAMFADIAVVDRIPENLLKPTSTGDGFTWYERESDNSTPMILDSDWKIEPLPKGFTVSSRFRHQILGSSVPSEHWVLSDGLANISIYFEKLTDDEDAFEGIAPMGVVNAFGLLNAEHQITVIGEVPAGTVEQLAHSVIFASGVEE